MLNHSHHSASSVRFVLFATGVAAIGGFLFGYDTAVINGANAYLKTFLRLSPAQEGIAGASAIVGCIPGAMFAGFVSDRFGRKKLLFFCALLYAISGVLSAIPNTLTEFLWARILSGVGIGASSMICPVYIAEIAPEKWRGRLGSLFQLGIVTGIFITLFVNKLIQGLGDEAWNAAMGWRWMLGMEVVPALLFMALLFAVPESPRWLLHHRREEEAGRILQKVGGADHAAAELASIREAMGHEEGNFSELFTGAFFRPLALAVALMAFSQFCGINAIMYYSTRIFEAIALVDRAGRKPLLLAGTSIQALALGLVGWMFHGQHHGVSLLLCVVLFIAAFAMAMGPISWLLCSEIFPNKVRGRAMSVAAFTVWTSCFLVAQTFPMLNDSPAIGPAKTFWIYAAVSLFSFFFVLLFVPETKGRTLEQIEKMWTTPKEAANTRV